MKRVLLSEHEVQRLDINQDVGGAEGEKADMPRRGSMYSCTWAKVKRRDWHGYAL